MKKHDKTHGSGKGGLITSADAARLAGVSRAAVSKAIKSGRLAVHGGGKGARRLETGEVLAAFAGHRRARSTSAQTSAKSGEGLHLLTATEAAQAVGVSLAAISRAIKAGRLPYVSKTRREYRIDPAALFHVFRGRPLASQNGEASGEPDPGCHLNEVMALRVANAKLEGELARARDLCETAWTNVAALEKDRDSWRSMCEWIMENRILPAAKSKPTSEAPAEQPIPRDCP